MHIFKEFITDQRHLELKEPYIIINVNISPKIYEYLQNLDDITFCDGEYHKYCGEIKVVINNFINYWEGIVDECVREADALVHTLDKKGALELVKDTEELQVFKQEEYLKAFGQVEDEEEQKILDDVNEKFCQRLDDIKEMMRHVGRFDKPAQTTSFLKKELELSISKKNAAFGLALVNCRTNLLSFRIRVSFEQILLRMSNNLKKINEKNAEELDNLMEELYDVNKDRLMVSRQYRHRTSDTAEVESTITKIQSKIEQHQQARPMAHLEEEVAYWERRTAEFQHIENSITKAEKELKRVTEYLERFNTMTTTEYPGSKKTCWDNMGENYTRRKAYLTTTLMDASKSIITFFAVPGLNRIHYKDNIGNYVIDEFGHQMYLFDYGNKIYHNTCDGKLVEYKDTDKYYYDEVGRHTLDENGAKVYQIAACASSYDLNKDDLLVKTTKDCGHSEASNPECKMTIKNPNIVEMLPAHDLINIKQTLTPETVKYIWDSVAYILPDALYDTGIKQSVNPIYTLANRLIFHKYHKNNVSQLKIKMKEADKYRNNIYQKRKEKAMAEALAFKAKQVQPRKPAESDDTETQQHLATLAARELLKNQLMYYQHY